MKRIIIESLLVFLSIFSINIFGSGLQIDTEYTVNYIFISLPQIFLVIYLISIKNKKNPENACFHPLDDYGITVFRPVHIIYALILFCTVFILSSSLVYLVKLLPVNLPESSGAAVSNTVPVPILLLFSIITGYKEEVFFRSYLLQSYVNENVSFHSITIVSTCLFALFHLYGGFIGIIIALMNGFIFCFVFKKTKSLHVIAAAHAMYNFTILSACYAA
jgi:membrane protease YdiL (CAAX protease family)